MKRHLLLPALLLSLSTLTWAGEPIGYVKTVSGEASIISEGKTIKAEVGMPVDAGAVIKTGKDGSLGISFRDNTLMSMGPKTEFAIKDYHYAPAEGKLKLSSKITRGTLDYVSGVIAKLKPEAVTIETPSGVIGVRGTHFMVRVEDE
ncbi:MAG: hypothetical protein RIR00_1868 [Pseudomonadota bacterium]|jgi:hypothetical protein